MGYVTPLELYMNLAHSVYKIGDRFTAFLLIFFFLLVMAAISDFYHDRDIIADTSDTFDTILGPLSFLQQTVIKMH